jgi:hypothetical protein
MGPDGLANPRVRHNWVLYCSEEYKKYKRRVNSRRPCVCLKFLGEEIAEEALEAYMQQDEETMQREV